MKCEIKTEAELIEKIINVAKEDGVSIKEIYDGNNNSIIIESGDACEGGCDTKEEYKFDENNQVLRRWSSVYTGHIWSDWRVETFED